MWQHQMLHHSPNSGQLIDYTLASALVTSPVWSVYLAQVNTLLTTVGLILGVWLGVRRLRRDYKRDKDE